MPDIDYLWKTLYQAVYALAASRGDIKERLHNAARALALLQREDFPRDLQDPFSQLVAQMTACDMADDTGPLTATLRVIDETEAVELAGKIVDVYHTIATMYVDSR